jgi:UDP-N-acetyl-D-mannosaminuronate dehydrogenase
LVLKEKGANVNINDPYYTKDDIQRIAGCESFQFPEGMKEFECILIVADHSLYRFTQNSKILGSTKNCRLVLDNTGIWRKVPFGGGTEYHVAGDKGWLA